jgi:hypothetical protein
MIRGGLTHLFWQAVVVDRKLAERTNSAASVALLLGECKQLILKRI